MKVFITGIAGFIGFHTASALHKMGAIVSGCDNFNSYYDHSLKRRRASLLEKMGVKVTKLDLNDSDFQETVLKAKPTHLLHLAAQAGVRYSITHPEIFEQSNLKGFLNVLETVRKAPNMKLVYASSSSVYGLNSQLPYSVKEPCCLQASFYGVTKRANELMAANYTALYGISAVGLRFFTVYGTWGRPDMALFGFTEAILEGRPIFLYNHGKMQRDFTFIDDIVAGTIAALKYTGKTPLFNLGNHRAVELSYFVSVIENALGKKAIIELAPLQQGDVIATFADITESQTELGFNPKTPIEEGIPQFVHWYKEYAKEGT
jgi:UDP-glucuronate 4-epimerase